MVPSWCLHNVKRCGMPYQSLLLWGRMNRILIIMIVSWCLPYLFNTISDRVLRCHGSIDTNTYIHTYMHTYTQKYFCDCPVRQFRWLVLSTPPSPPCKCDMPFSKKRFPWPEQSVWYQFAMHVIVIHGHWWWLSSLYI